VIVSTLVQLGQHRRALAGCTPGHAQRPWGKLAAIDLHGCERSKLVDSAVIVAFLAELVPAIGMEAHGPVHIDRFGDGELEGWSAMQFIKTSAVSVHADEVGCRCFVDVFSCKEFEAERAARIAHSHFGGTPHVRVLER
jgi:S-adenosylmethionine decarboxylase